MFTPTARARCPNTVLANDIYWHINCKTVGFFSKSEKKSVKRAVRVCCYIYVFLPHNLLPSSFRNLFLSSNHVHHYQTRLASQYRPHFCGTNIKHFSILFRGPTIWNSLPVILNSSSSIFVFKKIWKIISLIVVLSLKFYVFCTLCNQVSLCNVAWGSLLI